MTAPTCLEKGYTTHTCTRCSDNFVDTYVDALGHELIPHEGKDANCESIGWNAFDTCSRCDYSTYVEIPAWGHTPGEIVIENKIEATETENGSYDEVIYCTVCSKELQRTTKIINKLRPDTPVIPIFPVVRPIEDKLPFRDVYESDWYYDAVEYVYENGLMNGTGKYTFSPLDDTTRGMIVTILYRQSGSPKVSSDGKTWWSDARVWAMEYGVSNGTNMEGKITREQLAAMLYRYAKLQGCDVSARGNLNKFTDAAQVSDWATEAVQWAVGEGILGGRTNGTLDPKGLATRAEVAAMLMRFCKNVVQK